MHHFLYRLNRHNTNNVVKTNLNSGNNNNHDVEDCLHDVGKVDVENLNHQNVHKTCDLNEMVRNMNLNSMEEDKNHNHNNDLLELAKNNFTTNATKNSELLSATAHVGNSKVSSSISKEKPRGKLKSLNSINQFIDQVSKS